GRRDPARGSLRCECWDRDAWTWIADGAYREFPWAVQTRRPRLGPARLPSCLLLQQCVEALLEHGVRLCANNPETLDALCSGFAYEKRRGAVDAETAPLRHVLVNRRIVLRALDARLELFHVEFQRCGLLRDVGRRQLARVRHERG